MLYVAIKESQEKDFLKRIDLNLANIDVIDKEAKNKGQYLHRFVYEPYADGHAVYQIIKENKKTFRIRVCQGVGDDWVLPYWGNETLVDKDYILSNINRRDFLDELIANRTKK